MRAKSEADILWVMRAIVVTPEQRANASARYKGMADEQLQRFMEWFEVAAPPDEICQLPMDALVRQIADVIFYGQFHARQLCDVVLQHKVISTEDNDRHFTADGVRVFAGMNGLYKRSMFNTRGWDLIRQTKSAFGKNLLAAQIRIPAARV